MESLVKTSSVQVRWFVWFGISPTTKTTNHIYGIAHITHICTHLIQKKKERTKKKTAWIATETETKGEHACTGFFFFCTLKMRQHTHKRTRIRHKTYENNNELYVFKEKNEIIQKNKSKMKTEPAANIVITSESREETKNERKKKYKTNNMKKSWSNNIEWWEKQSMLFAQFYLFFLSFCMFCSAYAMFALISSNIFS